MTTVRYKLTHPNGETRGQTQWGPGAVYHASGEGGLCGPGWLHCYSDPVLAILLNPIHGNFANPRVCEVEVSGKHLVEPLKEGWVRMAFLRWTDPPEVTIQQRVRFAVLVAREVYHEPGWTAWAERWLSGEDQSREAARHAYTISSGYFCYLAGLSACSAACAASEEDAAYSAAHAAGLADFAVSNKAAKIDFAGLAQQAIPGDLTAGGKLND